MSDHDWCRGQCVICGEVRDVPPEPEADRLARIKANVMRQIDHERTHPPRVPRRAHTDDPWEASEGNE